MSARLPASAPDFDRASLQHLALLLAAGGALLAGSVAVWSLTHGGLAWSSPARLGVAWLVGAAAVKMAGLLGRGGDSARLLVVAGAIGATAAPYVASSALDSTGMPWWEPTWSLLATALVILLVVGQATLRVALMAVLGTVVAGLWLAPLRPLLLASGAGLAAAWVFSPLRRAAFTGAALPATLRHAALDHLSATPTDAATPSEGNALDIRHLPAAKRSSPVGEADLRAAATMFGRSWVALLTPEAVQRPQETCWATLQVVDRGQYGRWRVPLVPEQASTLGFDPPEELNLPRPLAMKVLRASLGEVGRLYVGDQPVALAHRWTAGSASGSAPLAQKGTTETLLALLGAWWSLRLENERLAADAEARLLDMVESLITSVEAKDPYTSGHSKRVCRYSELIAAELGFSGRALEEIAIGAALHDVGKLGIPEQVLRKPGRLDDEEWQQVRAHPRLGAHIVDSFNRSQTVLDIIFHHHEHFSGRGYPRGLAQQAIPLSARIVAVADALDAMTSARSYQRNRTLNDALDEVRSSAGIQFDPQVVEALLRLPRHELVAIVPPPPEPAAPAVPAPPGIASATFAVPVPA